MASRLHIRSLDHGSFGRSTCFPGEVGRCCGLVRQGTLEGSRGSHVLESSNDMQGMWGQNLQWDLCPISAFTSDIPAIVEARLQGGVAWFKSSCMLSIEDEQPKCTAACRRSTLVQAPVMPQAGLNSFMDRRNGGQNAWTPVLWDWVGVARKEFQVCFCHDRAV